MTAPVGADIESLCTKCGDSWHVVVAKVGEKIAKVQCKQCGATHRYRATAAAVAIGIVAPKRVTTRTSTAKSKAPVLPPAPEADLSRPVRPYRAGEAYATGERVHHPTFGVGVVGSSPGPGKMEVHFNSGPRILVQAKAASTIGRPPSRRGDGE